MADYTRLEVLADCICRKCSVIATVKRLQQEIIKLEEETGSDKKPSNSKKERLKRVRKMEARVRRAVAEERIEDDIKDVRMEKIVSPASTKQAMIARVRDINLLLSRAYCCRLASASPCAPHQPIRPLWALRFQKQCSSYIPRSPRPNALHHLRKSLYCSHLCYFNASTQPSSFDHTYAIYIFQSSHHLPSNSCRMPLWSTLVWTLHLLPPETSTS